MVARRKFATALFGAVATLLLATAPWGIGVSGLSSEAAAAPGGSGQGNNGNSGGDSGKGNSGKDSSDKGSSDKGNSGKGNSGGGADGSGGGGKASGGNPDPVKSGGVRPGLRSGDGFGQRGNEHINQVTGTRVEINGSNVEVVHRDGIREEITDGRYRMNDAQGRTIIERTATESDRARFRAMIR